MGGTLMTDFGRVFRMTVEGDGKTGRTMSDGIFMVIGLAAEPIVRAKMKAYRQTICIRGTGYWSGGLIISGELVPTMIDDPRIEWLDE